MKLFAVVCLLGACMTSYAKPVSPVKPDAETKPMYYAPEIMFHGAEPNPAYAGLDEIRILLKYNDEDGDICQFAEGADNLFVRDMRTNEVYSFRIEEVYQSFKRGRTLPTKGEISVFISSAELTNVTASMESVQYEIYALDRQNNKSNVIITDPILIKQYAQGGSSYYKAAYD
jgi:hypothetical protein